MRVPRAVEQPAQTLAGDRWHDIEHELVDETFVEERLHERNAPVQADVPTRHLLDLPYRSRHVGADELGVLPVRRLERVRDDVLAHVA